MTEPLVLLLDVQDHDLAADQLRHRRASLPERAVLADHEAAIASIDDELAAVWEKAGDLERTQRRLEDEVATLEDKAGSETKRMYSGAVSSPRELQAMQEEIDGLTRRQRVIEDDLLEVMEALEPLTEAIARLEAQRDTLANEAGRIRAQLAESEARVDGDLAVVEAERSAVANGVPDELLAQYERLRGRLGGVAVARLDGVQCTGCHLRLPATEVDAVRHAAPGSIVTHEECGRILVRV